MALNVETARKIIDSELESAGRGDGLEAAAPGGFCQLWPKAKPILTAASAFIFLLGPQAGAILTGLIKIGDEIFSQSCS